MRKLIAQIPVVVSNPEVLGIGGMIVLATGLWMVSVSVAFIVLGVLLLVIAVLKGRR